MSLVSTVDHTKWSRQIYQECIDIIRKPIEVGEMILRQICVEQGSNVPFIHLLIMAILLLTNRYPRSQKGQGLSYNN